MVIVIDESKCDHFFNVLLPNLCRQLRKQRSYERNLNNKKYLRKMRFYCSLNRNNVKFKNYVIQNRIGTLRDDNVISREYFESHLNDWWIYRGNLLKGKRFVKFEYTVKLI